MPITDYTTYADIRAALGTNTDELEDATLALRLYEDALEADLEDVALTVPSTYVSTVALETPTDAQARFLRATRQFATYSVAKHLTVSLALFSPTKVADGKAEMGRANDPYRETIKMVYQEYERARNRLLQAFESLGNSLAASAPRPYFSIVSPADDPITG